MRKSGKEHSMGQIILEKEKIKRKMVVAPKMENHAHIESSSLPQPQPVEYSRVGTDPTNVPVAHQNRFIPITTASSAATPTNPTTISAALLPMPVPSTHLPNFERANHEKVKATHDTLLSVDGVVVKKKIKKRAEISGDTGHLHANKLLSHHGDDNRQKQHKHATTVPLQGAPQNSSQVTDVFRFDPLT